MICDLYTFDSILVFDIILRNLESRFTRNVLCFKKLFKFKFEYRAKTDGAIEARTSINEHF